MAVDVMLVIVGLVGLARGADVFVVAAARLASAIGVSPVVIGAVVVGFGTGVPELIVSTSAAASDSMDIAAGNVIGSNLANLTLVLGVAGIIARPEVVPRVLRREAPLSFASVAAFALLVQGGLDRVDGVVLVGGLVAAVVVMLRVIETEPEAVGEEEVAEEEFVEEVEEFVEEGSETAVPIGTGVTLRYDIVRAVLGLAATVAGAQLLVTGARSIAKDVGLSGGFVGLTLVAIGTSLPELVTAVQSARRDETALLVGNVLGSNIFNSLAVAGACGLLAPGAIDDRGLTGLAVGSMVLVAGLAWVFLVLGRRLRRWEAVVLLAIYAATLPLSA